MKNSNSSIKYKLLFLILVSSFFLFLKPQLSFAALPTDPGIDSTPTPVPCQNLAGRDVCGDGKGAGDLHEANHINCQGPPTRIDYCYLSQDKVCNSGSCQAIQKTETSIKPNNPRLEDLTEVTVNGTGTCSQNINFDPGPGLHNPDEFQKPECKLTSSVCRNDSVQDQNYKCTWIYSCIGYRLSQDANNPIDVPTPFSTVFTSSNSSSCTSEGQYTVQKPLTCNPDNTTPITDPNGDKSHNLVAKSLNDDKTIAHAINISSLPDNYTQSAFDLIKAPVPALGVQAGFSALQSLQALVCNNTIAKLTGISFLYCRVNEDFANQKTKMFEGLAQNITDTSVPSNLQTEPSQNSCYLQDVKDPKTGIITEGNGIFNGIDIAMNSNYKANNPDNVQGYEPDPKNYNASIQGTVVSGDQRAPTINCSEKQFVDFNYPAGYIPPYFDQNAMGCSLSMTGEQPAPPGSTLVCTESNNWPINNPLGNFGDPECNFTKDGLFQLLSANDTKEHVNEWFNVIIPGESHFNPDSYRSHDLIPHTPDPAGAWGLYQMGRGKNSQYDHGDVTWQLQTTNAINYNHSINDNFCYWGTSYCYK